MGFAISDEKIWKNKRYQSRLGNVIWKMCIQYETDVNKKIFQRICDELNYVIKEGSYWLCVCCHWKSKKDVDIFPLFQSLMPWRHTIRKEVEIQNGGRLVVFFQDLQVIELSAPRLQHPPHHQLFHAILASVILYTKASKSKVPQFRYNESW